MLEIGNPTLFFVLHGVVCHESESLIISSDEERLTSAVSTDLLIVINAEIINTKPLSGRNISKIFEEK